MDSNGFQSPVSNNKLTTALVAGFVAWHMATITGYWYRIIDFPNLDWPRFNGILLMPSGTDSEQFVSGAIFHAMTSICYALIYVYLIYPRLSMVKIPNMMVSNLVKALIWGEVLAFLSALIWVPRLFPQFDPGFFTLNFEWKTTVGIFLWHAIWGLTLGAFYNPGSDSSAMSE